MEESTYVHRLREFVRTRTSCTQIDDFILHPHKTNFLLQFAYPQNLTALEIFENDTLTTHEAHRTIEIISRLYNRYTARSFYGNTSNRHINSGSFEFTEFSLLEIYQQIRQPFQTNTSWRKKTVGSKHLHPSLVVASIRSVMERTQEFVQEVTLQETSGIVHHCAWFTTMFMHIRPFDCDNLTLLILYMARILETHCPVPVILLRSVDDFHELVRSTSQAIDQHDPYSEALVQFIANALEQSLADVAYAFGFLIDELNAM